MLRPGSAQTTAELAGNIVGGIIAQMTAAARKSGGGGFVGAAVGGSFDAANYIVISAVAMTVGAFESAGQVNVLIPAPFGVAC